MKKCIALILMLLPFMSTAAIPEIEELRDKFQSNEDVTVVTLGGEMLKAQLADSSNSYAECIESLTVIVSEQKKSSKSLEADVNRLLKSLKLKPTTDIKDDGTEVKIYVVGTESVSDIIVYVIDGDELAFINISGEIPSSMVNQVVDAINNIG